MLCYRQQSFLIVIHYYGHTDLSKRCLGSVIRLAQTDFRLIHLRLWVKIMSKGQDSKKAVKKAPLLTAKEKKAAKKDKKAEKSRD